MIFRYWTVRLRPSPMSLTTLGAGVIVTDPTFGRVESRFLPSGSALLSAGSIGLSMGGLLRNFKNRIDLLNANQATLDFDGDLHADDFIHAVAADWNNAVIIDAPREMVAQSIDEATEVLFRAYVGEIGKPRTVRNVTRVRRAVETAYFARPIISDHLFEKPTLEAEGLDKEMDFAVVAEDEVFEISSVFNFATTASSSSQNLVEAWNWRVDRLRRSGGKLVQNGSTLIRLDKDAPVVAVIYPPETDRQKEIFFKSTSQWEDLGVKTVDYRQADHHAEELSVQMKAA